METSRKLERSRNKIFHFEVGNITVELKKFSSNRTEIFSTKHFPSYNLLILATKYMINQPLLANFRGMGQWVFPKISGKSGSWVKRISGKFSRLFLKNIFPECSRFRDFFLWQVVTKLSLKKIPEILLADNPKSEYLEKPENFSRTS